jgi:hypothetical protein
MLNNWVIEQFSLWCNEFYLCHEFNSMRQSKDVHECTRKGTRWVTCPLKTSPWQDHLVIKVHWVDNEVWFMGKQGAKKVGMTRHHMRQGASCLGVVQGARYSRGLFVGCKSLEWLMWGETIRLGTIVVGL